MNLLMHIPPIAPSVSLAGVRKYINRLYITVNTRNWSSFCQFLKTSLCSITTLLLLTAAASGQGNFQFPGMQSQTAPIPANGGIAGPKAGDTAVVANQEWINDFNNRTGLIDSAFVKNIITFRLNEALPNIIPKPFTAQLTYRLYFMAKGNSVYDSVASDLGLAINYDTTRGATYNTSSSLVFNNGYRVKVKITGITVADTSILKLLELDNTITYHNYYAFNCTNSAVGQLNIIPPAAGTNPVPDELIVNWAAVPGVTGYDLEWTYVDSSAFLSGKYGSPASPGFYPALFRNNATRANLTDTATSYSIPLLFEKQGILYARIRSVQAFPDGRRMESDWKAYNSYGFSGHQGNLNWQASTSFAEEGKRKSVVQYFDGALRNRQTVTKDNSTRTTIVAESFYDYQSRPVIQVLPTPTLDNLIHYTPKFNNINNGEYDKSHFDRDMAAYTCNGHADSMSSVSSGAARYYSPNNPEKNTGFNQWLPDAKGYPFTEVKFLADNTGRVASQGGVGPLFQPGSGHETKYYYGSPDQAELDGLFGTEAGLASHYFKNMVRDANGQYSVSYVDMHGRTVATALSGNLPDSIKLDYLASKKDSLLTKVLTDSTNNMVKGFFTESSKSLLLTQADNVTFTYTLPPATLVLNNCSAQPVSYNCLYDLEITITDDCNNQKLGGQPFVFSQQKISTANPVGFTKALQEGNYTVTKRLAINQASLAYLRDTLFVQNNLCKTLDSFVRKYIDSFVATQPGCGAQDCQSCLTRLGTYTAFRSSFILQNGWDSTAVSSMESVMQAEYNKQVNNCNLLCPKDANKIDQLTSDMLQDLTPNGGQYADTTNIDEWSIFYAPSIIGRQQGMLYQSPLVHYVDENGQPDTVYINGVPTLPNNLQPVDFINNFKRSWADSLLPLHPEYNRLQYAISNITRSSYNWDNDFNGTTTFRSAYGKGYLNPTSNSAFTNLFSSISMPPNPMPPVTDSFLILNPSAGNSLNNTLQYYYLKPGVDTVSLWGMASGAGYCRSADNACVLSNKRYPFADTSTCSGNADMAWKTFMSMYSSAKSDLVRDAIVNNNPLPASLENAFLTGAHQSRFEDNALKKISDSIGVAAGDTSRQGMTNNAAAVRALIARGYATTCAGYATIWWSQPAPCTTQKLQADSASILNDLINVCIKGSDSLHPNGSNSISPDSSYLYKNFDDVLAFYVKKYNLSHPDTISILSCNGGLILYPRSYNSTQALVNMPIYKKPDSCQCNRIAALYGAYQQQSATYPSFSSYLQRNMGISLPASTIDSLRGLCNGTITCNYLAAPIDIPPVLQCSYTGTCANCAAFNSWVDSFNVRYPGIRPSYNYSDSSQQLANQLFTAYMNNKLGFTRNITDYITFMDSCKLSSPTRANCSSLTWTVYNPGANLSINADLYTAAGNNMAPVSQFFTASIFNGPGQSLAGDYVLVDKLDSVVTADTMVLMQWRIKPAAITDMVNPAIQTGNDTYVGAQWTKDPADSNWLISSTRVKVVGGVVKGMGLQSNSHLLQADWVKISGSTGAVLFFDDFPQSGYCPGNLYTGPTLCPGIDSLLPVMALVDEPACADSSNWAVSRATNVYQFYRDSLKGSFQDAYIAQCLQAAASERFTATQAISEYHYTLYYYDQAGNLVKTVPPQGVVRSYDPAWLQQVTNARVAGQLLTPAHYLATHYRYNSLNQVLAQQSPDGGNSQFWYDRLGRLVLSQNAKQLAEGNNYSYTLYDPLGRITETGQVNSGVGLVSQSVTSTPQQWQQWLAGNTTNRYQVNATVYDQPAPLAIAPWLQQNASTLRNRVSYHSYTPGQAGSQPVYASCYNYDIAGNVKNLLHDYGSTSPMGLSGQQYKRMDYQYDLISGKVNSVAYQSGKPDAFLQLYRYDAENRLTDVYTTTDSVNIEHEAHYTYYKHGPLARNLLGNNQVQGIDYAYTLQGWLKGVNASVLNPAVDMGQDGNTANAQTQPIGRDAYGFSLHYFDGDYAAITNTSLFAGLKPQLGLSYKPLYNGNISSMAVNIGAFNSPRLYNYQYDQLNRLTGMDLYNGLNSATNLWDGGLTATGDYKERIAYDANGNITRYLRYGFGSNLSMDSLSYAYNLDASGRLVNNRLDHVRDQVTSSGYGTDLQDQPVGNYGYDAIGNLTSDQKAGIAAGGISWNVYGKITRIKKDTSTIISYQYDAGGNRVGKNANGTDTWYVRDAQGNVLAVYSGTNMPLAEQHIYGSSRLGMVSNPQPLSGNTQYLGTLGSGKMFSFTRGKKLFELSNHLGNVLVTISDKKLQHTTDGATVDYYTPDVLSANDYYSGGMELPGRTYSTGNNSYRYKFNGKEKDNEIVQYDYGFRIYDPRLVRFKSVDPLTEKYPQLTPYQFASNCPIAGNDLDGLEFIPRFKQNDPFSLTTWAFAKKYQNSTADKIISGTAHGVSKSFRNTGNFFARDMWKASTWKNVGAFFEQGILDMSTVKVAPTPLIDNKVQEFQDKVINGDAYTRSAYFSEFGTNLVTGALLDKGLGELGALKVFTNTGKTFKSASIRFTQNTVNDFATALEKVGSGKYDPIDIVKMGDGMYSTVDNTRLLAAQKLGVNIKSNTHLFSDALPESMLDRFKNNATGQYAKTWGEAIEYRTGNQTGGFAEQHGSNGTFVQPEIRSH